MDGNQLAALVVHNNYLYESVELDDMPTNNFNFHDSGETKIKLKESDVNHILSKCSHEDAQENFTIYTPLMLTTLDFLVKTHKNTAEDIYCLLLYSGYLTFTGRRKEIEGNIYYELKIPNQEIKLMFKNEAVPTLKAQQEM